MNGALCFLYVGPDSRRQPACVRLEHGGDYRLRGVMENLAHAIHL